MLFTIDKNTTLKGPEMELPEQKPCFHLRKQNTYSGISPVTQVVPAQSSHGGELAPNAGNCPPCLLQLPALSIAPSTALPAALPVPGLV